VKDALERCFNNLSRCFTDLITGAHTQNWVEYLSDPKPLKITKRILMNLPLIFQISSCLLILLDLNVKSMTLPNGFGSILGFIIKSATANRNEMKRKQKTTQLYKIGVKTDFSTPAPVDRGAAYLDWFHHVTPLHFCQMMLSLY
jgi:hypothetical protein